MARVLVCGTLAYDDIGSFATPLEPGTRNVKLERLDRGFGGCAMNIAYNLAGLGHRAVPFVYAGDDYSGPYARHVAAGGISEAGIFRVSDMSSARGIVLTGSDGAQFTAFYPGPSGLERWEADLEALLAEGTYDAVILAPDIPAKTVGCARRLAELPRRVWCPGQYAELLSDAEIDAVLDCVDLVVANRHEWQALCTHRTQDEMLAHGVRAIVSDGPGPVRLLPGGTQVAVPAIDPAVLVDPTGCGDALVAGLVSALLTGADAATAVSAGVRLAGRCARCAGAQRHPVRPDDC